MGLDNAFGHPHPEIVTRYSNRGSRLLFTGQQGAVEFAADHSGIQLRSSARSEYARFWLASQPNH
jgi:beta-lactamase superfamily II metal-dependent hydrolase